MALGFLDLINELTDKAVFVKFVCSLHSIKVKSHLILALSGGSGIVFVSHEFVLNFIFIFSGVKIKLIDLGFSSRKFTIVFY